MTCKNCIHYDICSKLCTGIDMNLFMKDDNLTTSESCTDFKDKSKFIELPCIAMVEQFIKDGKFDKKHTAHNGRIAVVYIDKTKWNSPFIDITEQFYNTDKAVERIQALKGRENNEQ